MDDGIGNARKSMSDKENNLDSEENGEEGETLKEKSACGGIDELKREVIATNEKVDSYMQHSTVLLMRLVPLEDNWLFLLSNDNFVVAKGEGDIKVHGKG
ncbi:hypothetical protein CCACVL1_07878 [Corchorus capsularis]|uniref:Uncharacterized protein n=1 Tax=Corchorus capsularis TaxID=210143 RepID=A0A1R3J3L5_COCAP|nr:hypothetical protein CCACVL1_07878 [Corchorus capsularis]